jgi:hypothetical protein
MNCTGEMREEAVDSRTAPKPFPKGEPTRLPPASMRRSLTLNEIHLLAYHKWEAAGRPSGDGTRFWLEAEQELLQQK